MTVKLSSSTPDPDPDLNGLDAIRNALVSNPHTTHLVVGVVDCSKITREIKPDGDVEVPTARFIHLEVSPVGRDADLAAALLDRAYRIRTGRDPLPLDFGSELSRLES